MSIRNLWTKPTSVIYLVCHSFIFIIGVILCFLDSTIAVAVGASLIAGGAIGWLIFVYVLMTENTSGKLRVLTELGLIDAFPARSARIKPQYDERLRDAREHIDIMGFGLRTLREDYLKQFPTWKTNATVRILLIDPEFPNLDHSLSSQRDKEERNPPDTIKNEVLAFRDATQHLIDTDEPRHFDIRIYRCLPSINIFRVDDELFWGPYLVRDQSRNLPTFVVSASGTLFPRLMAHFDEIWNDDELSRPVTDL